MRLRKFIKRFEFDESVRSKLTLGPGVRLHPQLAVVTLQAGADGSFPTDAGLKFATWVANPRSVKQWLGFEAVVAHGREAGVEVTSLGFRLTDGADEFWWDGGAWAVNTANWNTEAEVAANIAAFPVSSRSLGFIVNLATSDPGHAPSVSALKVLYASAEDVTEDLIYRSLVRALKAGVRPISDFPIEANEDLSEIKLDDSATGFIPETPYNIVDVDSVFDHTADPDHDVDLLASYDPGTKIATLSSVIPDGNIAWVRFVYEPEVAVTTSRDYLEVAKVPAIVLDDIAVVDASEIGSDDHVANKEDASAVVIPTPIQGDLEVVLHGLTDKGVDQLRLADAVTAFFVNNPLLTSRAFDEENRLWLVEEYTMATTPNESDIHDGRATFRVVGVVWPLKDAVDAHVVSTLKLRGDMDVDI
jgi:hypothetical protein